VKAVNIGETKFDQPVNTSKIEEIKKCGKILMSGRRAGILKILIYENGKRFAVLKQKHLIGVKFWYNYFHIFGNKYI
jgi:hypothetical protein